MKWFIPSWNGDLRLEAKGNETLLSIVRPTPAEVEILGKMKESFVEKGWLDASDWKELSRWRKRDVSIKAPLADVGPVASKIMRPGEAVLTAIKFSDGEVTTYSGPEPGLAEVAKAATDAGAEAAATVKRPTPSCPACMAGAVGPATEVLLSFLSPEQHASWAEDRTLIVEGGLTGTRYLLAHRNTPLAERIGRICYDLDAECVVHFHDRSVPPEEEVLASLLILRHREPWLRHEATMFGIDELGNEVKRYTKLPVFKNPFGDIDDGIADGLFTAGFGLSVAAARTG